MLEEAPAAAVALVQSFPPGVVPVLAWPFFAGVVMTQSSVLPNRKDPLEGVTTGGQPDAAGFAALAAEGFKTVIDLRGVEENRGVDEPVLAESLGMRYASLPVSSPADVTYRNAAALGRLLEDLPKPALVHCSTGNRAGALLALRAKLQGADARAALAVGAAGGLTGFKDTVERKLVEGRD